MENTIQEKYIKNSPDPISIEGTELILKQMKNFVCAKFTEIMGQVSFVKFFYQKKKDICRF